MLGFTLIVLGLMAMAMICSFMGKNHVIMFKYSSFALINLK